MIVTEAKKGGEAKHGNHFWNLKVDDGQEVWGTFKHDVAVGDEVVVWYEKDGKTRVKRPDKEQGQASSNGSSRQSSEWDAFHPKQRLIVRQSAIKAAVEIICAGLPLLNDPRSPDHLQIGLTNWIDWFERKTFEVVGASTGASETTRQEAGSHPQTAVRSQDDAAQPAPEVPVGAPPTPVDILKARLDYGIDPDTFSMLLASVGADSVQATTEEQRAELLVQLGQLKAA